MNGFITIEEISAELGINRNYAYALVKSRGFPAIAFGSKRVVPRQAWEKFIADPQAIAEFSMLNGNILEVGNGRDIQGSEVS